MASHISIPRMTLLNLVVLSFVSNSAPAQEAKTSRPVQAELFRLNDGTEVAKESRPTTSTIESFDWQPPLDSRKTNTVVDYFFGTDFEVSALALDAANETVYWAAHSQDRKVGEIVCAKYNGSERRVILRQPETRQWFLSLAPHSKKLVWLAGAVVDNKLQHEIYVSQWNGDNPQMIRRLTTKCYALAIDDAQGVGITNDGKQLIRFRLDGTGIENLPPAAITTSFAVDFADSTFYTVTLNPANRGMNGRFIHAALDGTRQDFLGPEGMATSAVYDPFIHIDKSQGFIYWWASGFVRTSLNNPGAVEQITVQRRTDGRSPCLAIDSQRGLCFWVAGHQTDTERIDDDAISDRYGKEQRIVSGKLPGKPVATPHPVPPEIKEFAPATVGPDDEVSLTGSGFASTKAVYITEFPSGKWQRAPFRIAADNKLSVTIPKLQADAKLLSIIVQNVGGATFTLSREATFCRSDSDKLRSATTSIVPPGQLDREPLKGLKYVLDGAHSSFGTVVLVRNGGSFSCLLSGRSLVIHEPFARITSRHHCHYAVAVPRIIPSYVDKLLGVNPPNDR